MTSTEMGFYKSHLVSQQINEVKTSYYIFSGWTMDNGIRLGAITDTMWLSPKHRKK